MKKYIVKVYDIRQSVNHWLLVSAHEFNEVEPMVKFNYCKMFEYYKAGSDEPIVPMLIKMIASFPEDQVGFLIEDSGQYSILNPAIIELKKGMEIDFNYNNFNL